MNPVRRLFADLVEKKLWPVALLLVACLVAIPVIIGSGGDDGSGAPDPAVALAPAPVVAAPVVELVGPSSVRTRAGAVRDPFRRTKVALAASPSGTSGTSGTSGGSGGSGGSSASSPAKGGSAKSGSGSPSSKTKKVTPNPSAPRAASPYAYQTVVRFTRPGGTRERPLYRLAVLGNASNPALQYLGVGADGEYAIFLLGPKATAAGDDGACVVADGCRVIGLRRGDKLGVDVAGAGASSRHYVIEVARVRRMNLRNAGFATAWRKRVDPIGRDVLDAVGEDAATASALRKLRYSTLTGTVGLTSAP